MSELRSTWTPEEVGEASASAESLPEAIPVHRDPPEGTATGADHMAGDEPYEESEALDGPPVPPDPPLNPDEA